MESAESTRVVLAAARRDPSAVGSAVPELAQRLGALTLFLPSLRTRRADIPQLVSHLLAREASARDERAPEVSEGAMLLLWRQDWPGNVRQLRDELLAARERAGGATIETRSLSPRLQPHARFRAFGPALAVSVQASTFSSQFSKQFRRADS
jgi:DNA-binding NtrC family response regulator